MTALTRLAALVQSPALAHLPGERFERVKQHILDTLGARLAGSQTDEGRAVARLAASMGGGPGPKIVAACAQARCTEVDDIHLTSCTTPGSVIVPAALALAAAGEVTSMGALAAAVLAGYEVLIRVGVAIDGPFVIHRNVWPTYFAAGLGSAAVAARAASMSVDQTAGALATALAFASGTPVPADSSSSSRWMTLGVAAANGVAAARSAREGLIGVAPAAGADFKKHVAGVAVSAKRLTLGLGRRYLFDAIETKPYPTARQGLSAIEAARGLAAANRLDHADIVEIVASLPERQRAIVDRPAPPRTRFASIVSLQYQMALALVAPERLFDVRRTPPFVDDRVLDVMSRIRVRRARDLERSYPKAWRARVEIRTRRGRPKRLVCDAAGQRGWDDVVGKFCRMASPVVGPETAERIAVRLRDATMDSPVPRLWEGSSSRLGSLQV